MVDPVKLWAAFCQLQSKEIIHIRYVSPAGARRHGGGGGVGTEGARESNRPGGWKRFSKIDARYHCNLNPLRAIRENANLPPLPPWRRCRRRSSSIELSSQVEHRFWSFWLANASRRTSCCAAMSIADFLNCPVGKQGLMHHLRKFSIRPVWFVSFAKRSAQAISSVPGSDSFLAITP